MRGSNLLGSALWVALMACVAQRGMASGYYGPSSYLSDGAKLTVSPEFYWDLEVKRLARDFHPTEKPALVSRVTGSDDGMVDLAPMRKATEDADAADYADAIKTGEIKPADAKAASQQHAAVRSLLLGTDSNATPQALPPEEGSEFADYDRGAYAYRLGQEHWAEARAAWQALLDRPAAERHYRTVWAAFMMGKLAMNGGDPVASKWYQKTRELAAQGFADSLGMAADSYGWEGRSEWKQGHPEKAAPLFLTQLALGDPSAIVSLKALIPDRDWIGGMENYDDDIPPSTPDGNATPSPQPAPSAKLMQDLARMAADPLLRRLETAYLLAIESGGQELLDSPASNSGCKRWLEVVRAAGLSQVENAEYLGWAAYIAGDYKEAQHWLELSSGTTPIAEWLKARLQLRAGDVKGAAASMAAAFAVMRDPAVYTGWNPPQQADSDLFVYKDNGMDFMGDYSMSAWAGGDTGSVRLLRSDFVQALDAFLKGGLRSDAAYVAERVLTTAELKQYVDHMPPPSAAPKLDATGREIYPAPGMDDTTWLRYVLGRRLAREGRYAEAEPYMPAGYGKLLGKYAESLKNGADSRLPKAVRADNWSTAAWLARYDGMELIGTEGVPDGFESEGEFESYDLPGQRLADTYNGYNAAGDPVTAPLPFPVTSTEKARLQQHAIKPDVRFHYRVIAAGLALRAAALMPDGTEELADALNKAGVWSDERDAKIADRCYDAIEKRCAGTALGKDILAHHWFVADEGPWSKALQSEQDALHKQYGIVPQSP